MPRFILPSLAGYKKKYLKQDFLAALVVTAIAIPESLGFAAIVGLPLVTGLYTALLAPIVFGLFAYNKRLIVGADSATAALVASGALLVAQAGTAQYASAVFVLVLVVAFLLVVMGLSRFGFIADFISRPVVVGFVAGVGVQLMIGKLPEMVGVTVHGYPFDILRDTFLSIGSWNGLALTISVLVVGIMMLTRKTKVPGALIGIVLAAVFAVVFQTPERGVVPVGALQAGLPHFAALPPLNKLGGMIITMLPVAFSIALVILAQSAATIRSSAAEHDEDVQLNRDMLVLGLANAASALTRGFTVNGSPPRTIAADMAGGRSQIVNILMALIIGGILLFGGHLFGYIPLPALAAVVFMIGLHLIRVNEFRYIYKTHRTEFIIALVTLLAVAILGVRQGILVAIIISLMERLVRQYRPHDQILLRDGELSAWARDRIDSTHRHSAHPPGLLVYRFDSPLFFENVEYFAMRVKAAVRAAKQPVKYVLIDAGAIDDIDYTAVEAIKRLYRHFGRDGIKLGFSHVSPHLRKEFDRYGVVNLVGEEHIFPTLNEAINMQPGNTRSALEMTKLLDIDDDSYVLIGGGVLEAYGLRKTHDVDLVVSESVYRRYRESERWQEYVQDNGKRILSRHGYNLMRSWMGCDLRKLRVNAEIVEGVPCMGIDDLIAAKQRLARPKDHEDIELLKQYRRR